MKQWAIALIGGLLLFTVVGIAEAVVSTSPHYKIQQDTITPVGGGENAASANYKTNQSVGEQASGAGASANYKARAAFRYLFNPVTQQAVPAPAPSSGGGGGGGGAVAQLPSGPTIVIIEGFTSPQGLVTILRDGQVVQVVAADTTGAFTVALTSGTAGTATFTIWSDDAQGVRSLVISVGLNILPGSTTTLSNVILSPTLSVPAPKITITDSVRVQGYAPASSTVALVFNSPDVTVSTTAGRDGRFSYALAAAKLGAGEHTVKAKAILGQGKESPYSASASFSIIGNAGQGRPAGETGRPADLNGDGLVNLTDFSIILANWGPRPINPAADINGDKVVDLVDISIMLYYWTG